MRHRLYAEAELIEASSPVDAWARYEATGRVRYWWCGVRVPRWLARLVERTL